MLLDWIGREGGAVVSWWLLTLLAAVAVYPLCFRLMRGLPSRGYALARAAGIMLVGFVFWLLNNYSLLRNTPGSTVVAWLIVLVLSAVAYATWRDREPILPWLRRHVPLILTTELLFIGLFVGWALVRALNPSLIATEKPMEMAFLAAVRRSASFPPHDPWFSGYAISYYHFGYILMGTLANLSGVTSGIAFNLAIPLLFALTGVGAFSVAYDLVGMRTLREEDGQITGYRPAIAGGLLAMLLLIIMGNVGTVLIEIPYQTGAAPASYLEWFNIRERNTPSTLGCPPSGSADPASWCYWWWFRYSRIVQDRNLDGGYNEIITEFPNFSFVLADMHPHVLALPFTLLAIGLSLNLVLAKRRAHPWEILLYAVFVGGMIFLNSWDAVYVVFFIGAEALRRLIWNGTGWFTREDWWGIAGFGASIVGLTALLYLPFFIGFRSQAGGLIPNVLWPTRIEQFFIMFAPFLVILGVFLAVEVRRARSRFNLRFAAQSLGAIIGLLVLAVAVFAVFAWSVPEIRGVVLRIYDDSGGLLALIPEILIRRLQGTLTTAVLLLALFAVIGRLFAQEPTTSEGKPAEAERVITYSPATGFVLLLIAAGAVLTLGPEFVYLRDGFGTRINTIFKLYYQTWVLWGIASAYAVWSVLAEPSPKAITPPLRAAFGVASAALILIGLVYPVFAIYARAFKEGGHLDGLARSLTLEGGPTLAQNPDEYAVIQCLAQVATSDDDVVAEATRRGLAYRSDYGRVSALTGIPTLLGWDNHEGQWRGNTFPAANTLTYTVGGVTRTETRYDAIATLYNTTDLAEARGVIARYGITYIFVGLTERRDYDPNGLAKFEALRPVCASGGVAVYAADSLGLELPVTTGR